MQRGGRLGCILSLPFPLANFQAQNLLRYKSNTVLPNLPMRRAKTLGALVHTDPSSYAGGGVNILLCHLVLHILLLFATPFQGVQVNTSNAE